MFADNNISSVPALCLRIVDKDFVVARLDKSTEGISLLGFIIFILQGEVDKQGVCLVR